MKRNIHSFEIQRLRMLLRRLREEAGMTQAALARKLGSPQSFVSKYESGERRLDIIEMRHIGAALGMSLPSLAERIEDAMRET